MEDFIDTMVSFLKTAFYITIGASVKLMHHAKKNTIDKKRVAITFTFAVFVGVITNHIMIIKGWHEWSGIAVSIAALLGESFVSYLLTNSNNIFRTFVNSVFKIDVENKDDDDYKAE
tara:strand:- start:335 stop:685 length:351 start_codon:yes stop_codon:yes gene_type:complete